MKKVLFLTVCAAVLAACSSAPKSVGINAKPKALTKAILKADKACTADADCVAVQKGCCMCDGYQAVSQQGAETVKAAFDKACSLAPCTREMCRVQIAPKCVNHVCTGESFRN